MVKAYPKYKDSGAPWIGQVPENWDILPTRTLFSEVKERGHINEQLLSVTISQGIIRQEDQNGVIKLVDKILAITKDEDYLQNPTKQAKVQDYEREIDQMVYKLYGLTDEEIKIVEGFSKED